MIVPSIRLCDERVVWFGDYVNNDLAGYHIAAHADVPAIEIGWINDITGDGPAEERAQRLQ
jgi:CO/xanthine dehydrogenase Mo-binding subunit